MAYSKINHEELSNKILRDPDAAVAKQLLIPASGTCALVSKRMLGIFDRLDQLQLAAETVSAINYVAEHDYLAYLMFLNRYDLIREIFWDKDLFAQQLALLDELENEEENEKYQQILFNEQIRLSSLTRQQQEQIARDRVEQKLREEKAMVHMDLYQYYRHLEQDIHDNFHKNQIQILDRAYSGRTERINRAVDIASTDTTVASEDKDALIKLQREYKEEYDGVQRLPSHNSEALSNKAEAAKRMDAKYQPRFMSILEKYPDHPQLGQIYREESTAVQAYQEELVRNEQERKQKLEEIRPHLERSREALKADLESFMSVSIRCLETCDDAQFTSVQERAEFHRSVEKLNEYKEALSQTTDNEQIKDLSNKFSEELLRAKAMVKPSMLDPVIMQKLENEVSLFSRLQHHLNIGPAGINAPTVRDDLPPPYNEIVHQDTQFQTHIDAVRPVSPPPTDDDLVRQDSASVDERQGDYTRARQTARYRDEMFAHRNAGLQNQREVQTDLNSAPLPVAERTAELETQYQDILEKDIPQLQKKLSAFNKLGGLSVLDKQLIIDSKRLCDEISPTVRGQVAVSKLELLKTNLDSLIENHPEFNKFANNLDSIISSCSDSPRINDYKFNI